MSDGDYHPHPILDRPHTWELTEFFYCKAVGDNDGPHIDMTFERDGAVRRLRFYRPQALEISLGEGPNAFGMFIEDVSERQLEGIGVRVGCFDQPHGCPCFWAAKVVDVDVLGACGRDGSPA